MENRNTVLAPTFVKIVEQETNLLRELKTRNWMSVPTYVNPRVHWVVAGGRGYEPWPLQVHHRRSPTIVLEYIIVRALNHRLILQNALHEDARLPGASEI